MYICIALSSSSTQIRICISSTELSIFLGLSLSCCCNNLNHSDLDESFPLFGGVIPKTVSRIDLILSFVTPSWKSHLICTLQLLETTVDSICPFQLNLSQEHYSFGFPSTCQ